MMGTSGTPRAIVELVLLAIRDGETIADVAHRFDLAPATVRNIALGRTQGRPESPADRAERWAAACLDPDEWAAWQRANRVLSHSAQAARPCDDCLAGFAADMRVAGTCNGIPGLPREAVAP